MQLNEHAEHARQGKRQPDIDRAFGEARAKPASRAKHPRAAESRRLAPRPPTPRPVSYGAGF
jgi:hypothetical protein